MAELLDLAVAVSLPGGGWLEIEDVDNGYEIHEDSFTERAVQHRTKKADGIWTDGSWGVRATKDNVTESITVWVLGNGSHFAYAAKMAALKAAFDQMSFQVRITIGDMRETWTCTLPADYTETTDKPMRFATTGMLRVQVARLPKVLLEEVA